MISAIKEWFNRAVPNPTLQNKSVQLGCHFEEIYEMLEALSPGSTLGAHMKQAADESKRGPQDDEQRAHFQNVLDKIDRIELLDALCDQIVTAVGVAHMLGLNIEEGLKRVNESNWSKFDQNGQPIFNEQGKIKKGPNYVQADLSDLV